jgi:hypothetical protein
MWSTFGGNKMNKIYKVYGHHRSGNNYLCALLYKNFYSGMESLESTIIRNGRRFVLFGEEVKEDKFTNPYGRLWGSHNPQDVTADSIYIIRDGDAVRASIERREWPTPKFFCSQTEKVLREIQQHFELVRLYKNFITEVGYCGWPD